MKDTFDFVEAIRDMNVDGKQMLSLDVTSLFTCVPLTETIDFLCNYIRTHNIQIPMPTDILKELLLRCTLNVQFLFNGKLYRQKDVVAMGSPLGPLLADICLGMLDASHLKRTIEGLDNVQALCR